MKQQPSSLIASLLTLLTPIVGIIHLTQTSAEATEVSRLVAQVQLSSRNQQSKPFERTDALYSIAMVYAEAGVLERAREMAVRLPPSYQLRDKLLVDVTHSFAAQSQFSEALSTAEAVEHPRYRADALAAIAATYAETGQSDAASSTFEQALQLARRIGDLPAKTDALEAIANRHVSVGNLSQAYLVAREIPIVNQRISTLLDIATQYDNQGQTARSLAIFNEVKAFVQNLVDDDCGYFQTSIPEVATHLALAQGSEQALQFAQSLTPCRRIYALQAVAQNYARTGQQSDAIALLDRAYTFFQSEQFRDQLQSTTSKNVLVQLWREFAPAYRAVGRTATAIDILKQAEVLAQTLPQEYPLQANLKSAVLASIEARSRLLVDEEKREQALQNIDIEDIETEVLAVIDAAIDTAQSYARTDRNKIARQILAQAEALAITLPEASSLQSQLKQFIWARIAQILANTGEYERALEIAENVEDETLRKTFRLDQIQPTAQPEESKVVILSDPSFPGPPPETQVMQLIESLDIPNFGARDTVLQGLDQALALAQSTPQAGVQVRELVEIAYWYAQLGKADQATAILQQAFAIAQRLKD